MQITSFLQNGQHSNAEKVLKAEINMKKKCIILIKYLIPLVGSIQGSRVINEQQESTLNRYLSTFCKTLSMPNVAYLV